MNLLLCKGCGCAYVHTHVSNGDFCQFCCSDIAAAPAAFKILKERNEEKLLARAANVVKRLAKRGFMETTVKTIEEAKEWFLANHEGDVLVIKPNGDQKRFDNYPDAKAFLES